MIIHSFEMGERMYQIYSLRGYNGGIPVAVGVWPLKARDFAVAVCSVLILVLVVIPWNL